MLSNEIKRFLIHPDTGCFDGVEEEIRKGEGEDELFETAILLSCPLGWKCEVKIEYDGTALDFIEKLGSFTEHFSRREYAAALEENGCERYTARRSANEIADKLYHTDRMMVENDSFTDAITAQALKESDKAEDGYLFWAKRQDDQGRELVYCGYSCVPPEYLRYQHNIQGYVHVRGLVPDQDDFDLLFGNRQIESPENAQSVLTVLARTFGCVYYDSPALESEQMWKALQELKEAFEQEYGESVESYNERTKDQEGEDENPEEHSCAMRIAAKEMNASMQMMQENMVRQRLKVFPFLGTEHAPVLVDQEED